MTIITVKDTMMFPRPGNSFLYCLLCKSGLLAEETCARDYKQLFDYMSVFMSYILPYGVPSFFCVISMMYQLFHLSWKPNRRRRISKTRRRLTTTIVMLTLSFLVFGGAHFTALVVLVIGKFRFSPAQGLLFLYMGYPTLGLNSMITPLIMCIRGKSLNEFVKTKLSMRNVNDTSPRALKEPNLKKQKSNHVILSTTYV